MATKKEVAAEAKNTTVALPEDMLSALTEHEGQGLDYDTSELQIPFIRVIQSMSPQINKRDTAYIPDTEVGDIFNTVTGQHWEGEAGITVIPCYQETKYLKFVPREQGGGFLGELAKDDPDITKAQRSGAKEILPDGNELVKSDQHYCLLLSSDGSFQPVVVDMKSTQLKVSRRWKTQIAMQKIPHPKTEKLITPPVFATSWKLTTTEESNDQGTWANYQIAKVGLLDNRDVLLEAKAFRDSVAAGEVKAVKDPDHDQSESQSSIDPENEIPF